MNLATTIQLVVKQHVTESFQTLNNKQALLALYGIGNSGFDAIINELQHDDDFRYKRLEIVTELIQHAVANTIYELFK